MIYWLRTRQWNGKPFPMKHILRVVGMSSSTWYDTRERQSNLRQKPGPKSRFSDEQITSATRELLADPIFTGEGYLKLRKRLKMIKDITVAGERLRYLLDQNNLLVQQRKQPNGAGRTHDGEIITDAPNQMWACDIKQWWTVKGKLHMFTVIEHFNSEVLSCRTAVRATQSVATDIVRTAVKHQFGNVDRNVCKGLALHLRTDNGSQFIADKFEKELKYLDIDLSKAFVRSPECNGVIERYHETIKGQVGHEISHSTNKQANQIIIDFMDKYNKHWLLHRLGLVSPKDYRKEYESSIHRIDNQKYGSGEKVKASARGSG